MSTSFTDNWTDKEAELALNLYVILRPDLLTKGSLISLTMYLDLKLGQENNKNNGIKQIIDELGKPTDDVVAALLQFVGLDPEAKSEGFKSVSPVIQRAWHKHMEHPKEPEQKPGDGGKSKGKETKPPNDQPGQGKQKPEGTDDIPKGANSDDPKSGPSQGQTLEELINSFIGSKKVVSKGQTLGKMIVSTIASNQGASQVQILKKLIYNIIDSKQYDTQEPSITHGNQPKTEWRKGNPLPFPKIQPLKNIQKNLSSMSDLLDQIIRLEDGMQQMKSQSLRSPKFKSSAFGLHEKLEDFYEEATQLKEEQSFDVLFKSLERLKNALDIDLEGVTPPKDPPPYLPTGGTETGPDEPKTEHPYPKIDHYLKVLLNDEDYKAASWKEAFACVLNRIDILDREHLLEHIVKYAPKNEFHIYESVDHKGYVRIPIHKSGNLDPSSATDRPYILKEPVNIPNTAYYIDIAEENKTFDKNEIPHGQRFLLKVPYDIVPYDIDPYDIDPYDSIFEPADHIDNTYKSSLLLAGLLKDCKAVDHCVIMHMFCNPIDNIPNENKNKEPIILKAPSALQQTAPDGNGTPTKTPGAGSDGHDIPKTLNTHPGELPSPSRHRLTKKAYLKVLLDDEKYLVYSWKETFFYILERISSLVPEAVRLVARTQSVFLDHLVEHGFNIYQLHGTGYVKIPISGSESEQYPDPDLSVDQYYYLNDPVNIPNTHYYIDIYEKNNKYINESSFLLLTDTLKDCASIDRCIITQIGYNPTDNTFFEDGHPIVLKIPPPIHLPTPWPDNLTPYLIEAVAQDKDLMTVRQARYRGILHPDGIAMFLANYDKKWGCFERVTDKDQYDELLMSFNKNHMLISVQGIIIGMIKDFKEIGFDIKIFDDARVPRRIVRLVNVDGEMKTRNFYYLNYMDFQRKHINDFDSENIFEVLFFRGIALGLLMMFLWEIFKIMLR